MNSSRKAPPKTWRPKLEGLHHTRPSPRSTKGRTELSGRELQMKFLTSVQCKCLEESWSEQCTLRRSRAKIQTPQTYATDHKRLFARSARTEPQQTLEQIFAPRKHHNFFHSEIIPQNKKPVCSLKAEFLPQRGIYIATATCFQLQGCDPR